jgi:hypothetical protein
MTLPSIVDEDMIEKFHALDNNGNFKVCFRALIFYFVNNFLANNRILHQFEMLGVSSMSGI